MTFREILLCTLVLLCCFITEAQQPSNDNCPGEPINITNGGFDLGPFTSANVNLFGATTQGSQGEVFDFDLVSVGNDEGSVWYNFRLPTARSVTVSLNKVGSISTTQAGFTVYRSGNCYPTLGDLSRIPSISSIASSGNFCLQAGDYLIQVGISGTVLNPSEVFVELLIDTTAANNDNYDFGFNVSLG